MGVDMRMFPPFQAAGETDEDSDLELDRPGSCSGSVTSHCVTMAKFLSFSEPQ